jgi:hypothetical protein
MGIISWNCLAVPVSVCPLDIDNVALARPTSRFFAARHKGPSRITPG